MKLSPKAKRNIARIIPFGLIWLFTGWVFMMVEVAAMGTPTPDSPTIISLNASVFAFASIAVFIVGLFVGAIELIFLEDLFRNKSFSIKILYKFGIYTIVMLVVNFVTYPIAASLDLGVNITDLGVWEKFSDYLVSETFLSTLLQMTSSIMLSVIYAGISENLGHSVFVSFITGKYHRPREEQKIFMFLDMKDSTTVAEKLGHIRYFELLRDYYSDLSDAIINHYGEVYQYIGDEVVISWNFKQGLTNNHCVLCFFAMKNKLETRSDFYMKKYGFTISFKAGMHLGDVTTGEIGALKKEIFFTGDVLNVTSRIQGLCNQYQADLLISADLMSKLTITQDFNIKPLGEVRLKGRSESMEIYAIARN